MITCAICCQEFKNNLGGQFTIHLYKEHCMELRDYVIKTQYDGISPSCACGLCNEIPVFYRGEFKQYAKGHHTTSWYQDKYIEVYGQPTCLNCGYEVGFHRKEPKKYCSNKCAGLHKGGFTKPEVQQKIDRYRSEEVRRRLSENMKERWLNGEFDYVSPETIAKISQSSKMKWEDPAYRKKVSKAISASVASNPKELLRRSQFMKGLWKRYPEKMAHGCKKNLSKRLSGLHSKIRTELDLDSFGFVPEQVVDRYIVDEFCRDKNIIIEINGDYVHANPSIYKVNDIISLPGSKYTAFEKWESDRRKIDRLKELGYMVYVIWESDDLDIAQLELLELLNE
jgi:hypothetical protein